MYQQKVFLVILSMSLLLVVTNTASAQILLFDDFNGGGTDVGDSTSVNGGFRLTGNSKGLSGIVDERDSYAELISREKKNANSGITSINTIDPLSAAVMSEGLTVEWVVKSISTESLGGHGNIYTLGTQGDEFFNVAPYIGVTFNGKAETKENGVRFVGQMDTGEPSHPLSQVYNFDPLSFLDGFTVRFTINETGWIFEVEGLDIPVWEEGVWTDFHPRDALDNDCFVAMHTQIPADGEIITQLDSVTAWIGVAEKPDASKASAPKPEDESSDVLRDVVLAWEPGESANTHDVYLGTNFDDVNNAERTNQQGVLAVEGQISTMYDSPNLLDFGKTHYWRVDEVGAPPDSIISKGDVWSFTVEPVAYPLGTNSITATASSSNSDTEGPENTINGSGLDDDDLHSTVGMEMWLSSITGPQPSWIQYEFDRRYKLHEMLIWNYNSTTEPVIGYGVKEALIEYSADGAVWVPLNATYEFAQGSGVDGYASNTTIDLGDIAAKYVRITANSNWGDLVNQFGLSEVRFLYIPVWAQEPDPVSDTAEMAVNPTLSWRSGRDAAEHNVYLSTDKQAVADGTALVESVTESSYTPSVDLGSTYYWMIEEVNDTETPSSWQGDVWSFSTQEYLVVDDFESYNEIPAEEEGSNLVYSTWKDGYDNPSTNGATIGYVTGQSLETSVVYDGGQSVPLSYDNTTASVSEVTVNTSDLAIGSDWSIGSPETLVLWIHGDISNAPEQMYVKVGNAKVLYNGDITQPLWRQWNINLTVLGIDLSNVTQFAIGIDRTSAEGGAGMVLIDEIRLYKQASPLPSEEIWIEAEAVTTIEEPMRTYPDSTASGGMYIMKESIVAESPDIPPADGLVTYTFEVAGGTYTISGRVITNGGNDSFWVRIPGATTQTLNHASGWVKWNGIAVEDAWGWEEVFSDDDSGKPTVEFTMPAGTYTLELRYGDDESQLDALLITSID